jgi:hypothetical protein
VAAAGGLGARWKAGVGARRVRKCWWNELVDRWPEWGGIAHCLKHQLFVSRTFPFKSHLPQISSFPLLKRK